MILIFTTNGLQRQIDPEYNKELRTVHDLQLEYLLFDFDRFVEGNIKQAFKYIDKQHSEQRAIYRGWMMTPEQYEKFFIELLKRNIVLINSPFEYERTHCLYNAYYAVEAHTPFSTFILEDEFNDATLAEALKFFHGKQVFFRDFYKSEKMLWKSAAFIPDGSDIEHVKKVIQEFISFRDRVRGGYVFREFLPLNVIGKHPYPGVETPIANEWRIYFLNDKVIDVSPYWEEGDYSDVKKPPMERFSNIGEKIDSSFFTMDVAETEQGSWIIIELGDGQVSGLTKDCDHHQFYNNLRKEM